MQKLIIKHLKGSKANQVEFFDLPVTEILLGRDPGAQIVFDPIKDDLVSRRHLKITQEGDDRFTLTDLDSRNGTFVNRIKVAGATRLQPGDVIQLGEGGPEFLFDLDPRRENVPGATRIVAAPTATPMTREQRIGSAAGSNEAVGAPQTAAVSGGVGRATVERLISETRSDTRRNLINIGVGVLGLIVAVAGFLIYQSHRAEDETKQQLAQTQTELQQQMAKITSDTAAAQERERQNARMSATTISQDYGASTVFIETSWKLIHIPSGQQLHQKVACIERDKKSRRCRARLPWYVFYKGSVEPLLETASGDADGGYSPIGTVGHVQTGSGFVVTDAGYILTNRHVAASWETRGDQSLRFPGYLLICPDDACSKPQGRILEENDPTDIDYIRSALGWVPSKTKTLGGKPITGKLVEGRPDYLEVTFPKTQLRIPARLVRVSDTADVALIKIDVPQNITPVQMSAEAPVQAGDTITVLGYPAVSPDIEIKVNSQDPMSREGEWRVVPEPTVTGGNVGKVIRGDAALVSDSVIGYFSEMGDVYQLTVNSTGSGNSGGPIFNDKAQVIGIFTYGRSDRQGTQITFAVPIKYGMDIMGIQRVVK